MLHFNVRGKGLILLRQECYSHTKTVADFPLQNKESFVIITKLCFAALLSPSSSGQDAALSRRNQGFESPWRCHFQFVNELLFCLVTDSHPRGDAFLRSAQNSLFRRGTASRSLRVPLEAPLAVRLRTAFLFVSNISNFTR